MEESTWKYIKIQQKYIIQLVVWFHADTRIPGKAFPLWYIYDSSFVQVGVNCGTWWEWSKFSTYLLQVFLVGLAWNIFSFREKIIPCYVDFVVRVKLNYFIHKALVFDRHSIVYQGYLLQKHWSWSLLQLSCKTTYINPRIFSYFYPKFLIFQNHSRSKMA